MAKVESVPSGYNTVTPSLVVKDSQPAQTLSQGVT
jgi:hypothetical protein